MNETTFAALAQSHLDELVHQIGCRMIGTPGNTAAASYILETLMAAGLSCRRQTYRCPAWEAASCSLHVGTEHVPAIPNTFSPPCDVRASSILVRTFEELDALDLTERILVLSGDLTRTQIMPLREHVVYLPENDRRLGEFLRAKRPLAVITVSTAQGFAPPLLEDPTLTIPSATVPAEAGLLIARHPDVPIALEIASDSAVGETSNIIGTNLEPTGTRRVILCAHYDTKVGTVGARDNASGTAALLTLAQFHASTSPQVSLEFVAFSAEEYPATEDTQDDVYLREYGLTIPPFVYGREVVEPTRRSGLDEVLVVLNFDGIGSVLTPNTVATMASSDRLKRLVRDVRRDYKGLTEVAPWPASNHYAFYANGIPSIAMSSGEIRNITHTAADGAEWVSGERVAQAVQFARDLIVGVADKQPDWTRA